MFLPPTHQQYIFINVINSSKVLYFHEAIFFYFFFQKLKLMFLKTILGSTPFFHTTITSMARVRMDLHMCCTSMEDILPGDYNILY